MIVIRVFVAGAEGVAVVDVVVIAVRQERKRWARTSAWAGRPLGRLE